MGDLKWKENTGKRKGEKGFRGGKPVGTRRRFESIAALSGAGMGGQKMDCQETKRRKAKGPKKNPRRGFSARGGPCVQNHVR